MLKNSSQNPTQQNLHYTMVKYCLSISDNYGCLLSPTNYLTRQCYVWGTPRPTQSEFIQVHFLMIPSPAYRHSVSRHPSIQVVIIFSKPLRRNSTVTYLRFRTFGCDPEIGEDIKSISASMATDPATMTEEIAAAISIGLRGSSSPISTFIPTTPTMRGIAKGNSVEPYAWTDGKPSVTGPAWTQMPQLIRFLSTSKEVAASQLSKKTFLSSKGT